MKAMKRIIALMLVALMMVCICSCGAKNCSMEVHGTSVDLVCTECGGRLRIPAATDEDLDRLCCHYTLTIKGNR